ncbi:metallophosphoesterase family protein [Paenibacillus tritici]|uniref:Metallophosphoesterase family protein n=1 Tax=Paenibacillus tritici TaxID=1873425 RepID=A0ABX2DN43_9BACL|nr:metallophosphoesterase [Paenibacillus tritici]NQX44841.1 metallophosphoesterase family protein [Paenibacillus tritici]
MELTWLLILLAVCLGVAGVMGILMVAAAFKKQIIAEDIVLERLPAAFDGFRILFITDIHRRRLPEDMLNPLRGKVDAVLLGGDLTEKGSPIERLLDNLTLAASIAPVYAVHGNHDYRANITLVDRMIRGSGAMLLEDENHSMERAGARLILTGVDFPRKGGKMAYSSLPGVSEEDAGAFRMILVHDPLWLSRQQEVPADLILAGHTHGGQVVLPLLRNRHTDEFYRKYNAGMYEIPRAGESALPPLKMLISRGYGTAHLPLRWGSPAEMHVLTLRCGEKQHSV